MILFVKKYQVTAVCLLVGMALAGCSRLGLSEPTKEELPRNAELTTLFRKLVETRGLEYRDPRVERVSLFCEKTPGPIKVKVTLDAPGNEMKAPYVSATPCSESGELVTAVWVPRGAFTLQRPGYYVRSKQPYDTALVAGEWNKALDAVLGTFSRNELASESISQLFSKPLNDLHVEHVVFTCETTSKKVVYRALYQGDWRTGTTTVACPETADLSEALVQLSEHRDANWNGGAASFKVSTVKAIDALTATKLVQDFLQVGGRRGSF